MDAQHAAEREAARLQGELTTLRTAATRACP